METQQPERGAIDAACNSLVAASTRPQTGASRHKKRRISLATNAASRLAEGRRVLVPVVWYGHYDTVYLRAEKVAPLSPTEVELLERLQQHGLEDVVTQQPLLIAGESVSDMAARGEVPATVYKWFMITE